MPREEIIAGDEENIVGALLQTLRGTAANPSMRSRVAALSPSMARMLPGATVAAPRFQAAQVNAQVGGGGDSKLRAPLGLGAFVYSAGATTHNFVVEPQEAFRGERLVIEYSTETAGVLLMVSNIFVGSLPQTPSSEWGIPAAMFRPDATGAEMEWQICPAGTKIIVQTTLVGALAEADTATATVGIYGEWIRG